MSCSLPCTEAFLKHFPKRDRLLDRGNKGCTETDALSLGNTGETFQKWN